MTKKRKGEDNKARGKATPETVEQMAKRLWAEATIPLPRSLEKRCEQLVERCLRWTP